MSSPGTDTRNFRDQWWFVTHVLSALWKTRNLKAALNGGWRGGLDIKAPPDFDELEYLRLHPDVRVQVQAGSFSSGFVHYVRYGRHEGRGRPLLKEQRPAQEQPGDRRANPDYEDLRTSGVFDPVCTRGTGPFRSDADAFDHYWHKGRSLGHQPCFYFEPEWYLSQNADVRRTGEDAVLHYLRFGEAQGRWPGRVFDPAWYTAQYGPVRSGLSALADYLSNRSKRRNPSADFDVEYMLAEYADLASVDPVEHYVLVGYRELRNPSPEFNTRLYIQIHLAGSFEENPLIHYVWQNRPAGLPLPGFDGAHTGAAGEIRKFSSPGPAFEEWRPPLKGGRGPRAKVVAFYLPQFHRIPENDKWWGTGFTEWTNLARGVPRCRGHYQPRIPRDLGFYDLSEPEAIRRQVAMAESAGLHGFCFYFYWFNKKRLLEKPLDLFVNDPSLDFPFCLMWANENWTRRWDGLEQDVLLQQFYDPDHDEDLIDTLAAYFKSPRYMRAGDRPIFTIYRPDQVPDGRRRFERWRELWRTRHNLNPVFLMAQSFHNVDPAEWGLDGAVEFPPHRFVSQNKPLPPAGIDLLDLGFSGAFYRYEDLAREGIASTSSGFPLIKTVSPSWDNDARRQGTGSVFLNSTPALYEHWLRQSIEYARDNPLDGESLVFVNAWNEWAEAAYLEPDVHNGAAYLNASARAIYGLAEIRNTGYKVLLVGHDAHPHGAQALMMSIARTLTQQFGMSPTLLLLEGGPLVSQYESICPTIVLPRSASARSKTLASLAGAGYVRAVMNTTVSGGLAPLLKQAGIRFVSLIHELPRLITERRLESSAAHIASHAEAVVFAHPIVRDGFLGVVGTSVAPVRIRPQGSYNTHRPDAEARTTLRSRLGIAPDARIVLNVGYGDARKGFDLFVQAARETAAATAGVHFVWLGKVDPAMAEAFMPKPAEPPLAGRFHQIPFESDPQRVMDIFGGADLFFLSSREDPYPTVLLEALAAGLDLVAFDGGGGFVDLVRANGELLPTSDPQPAARAIERLLAATDPGRILRNREARRPMVENEFSLDRYCSDVVRMIDPEWRCVSVIVPNYNYGRHLRSRLSSIFEQTYPVFEIIVLDDASTDDSLDVIESVSGEYRRVVKVVRNTANSGSAFHQWRKGLEAARGEFVWVAEADDLSAPDFLATLVKTLADKDAAFAFSDSWQIDEHGKTIGSSYAWYCNHGRPGGPFDSDFVVSGEQFVQDHLAIKNTILNVSAVLWRRDALREAMETVGDSIDAYRVAGDWRLYVQASLGTQSVAYVSRALNGHRRHESSVTHALDKERHHGEIVRMHRLVSEAVSLDKQTLGAMGEYEEEVASQFGLRSARQ